MVYGTLSKLNRNISKNIIFTVHKKIQNYINKNCFLVLLIIKYIAQI